MQTPNSSTPIFVKRGLIASGCMVAGFALTGCGGQTTDTTSNSSTETNTTTASATTAPDTNAATASTSAKPSGQPFRVAYNQWIGLAGVFIAKDKGYFKDTGLNVDFKQFSGPADGVPPLIAGQLDAALTTADTPILLGKRAGTNPLVNVYITDTSNGADGIVAQKGIASVKDLKGKTVAATKGQVNEFLLLKALQANGMSESDVNVTNMDADASGAAIVANKIPAAVTWEPWLSKAGSGGAKVIFSSKDAPNTILDVCTVSKKTLDAKAADVRAFVAAAAKGAEYANAHPDEAAQVASKYFSTKPAEAKDMLTKVKIYGVADNHRLMGTASAPGPAYKTVAEIGKFFVSQKSLDTLPDTAKTFSADYLPK